MENSLCLKEEFKKIEIDLSDRQAAQLDMFYQMLVEKNKVMNLTAITEFPEVVQKHFIDSCLFSEKLFAGKKASLIDVGTGAGFPGIPLKILYPELQVCLLDSLNKRILFLEEVIRELGLTGIETRHARAEDGARDSSLREYFDFAVSRAVANMSTLSEYCLPYVKKGGLFVAYKSGTSEEELAAAEHALYLLGGKTEKVLSGNLPDSDIARKLICVKKTGITSKKYPRKVGLPGKEPLS